MEDNSYLFKPFTHDEKIAQTISEAIKTDDLKTLEDNWKYLPQSQSALDSNLRRASYHGSHQCIDYLASQGADVNHDEQTCLYRALKSGKNLAVDSLLKHGADINGRNNCPARYAACHDDKELAEIIFVRHNLKVTPEIQTILDNHDCPGVKTIIKSRDLHDKLNRNVSEKKDIPKQELQTTRSGNRKL